MAIKGSLKEASLPDVLQLLALGQKTGRLSLADRANLGYIYFNKGRISYASIVNRRDRLGDILLKNNKITQQQIEAAIERQSHDRDKRLGELLVEEGAISREELEQYMRLQIEEAVLFLFTWSRGNFNFESDVHPESQDFVVSINPESLLLEGARRIDEWALIEKKLPSQDIIFAVDRERFELSQVTLTAEQERVLALIDGERDVDALVDQSGLGEFEVGKALYGLITAGFLRRVGRRVAARTSPAGVARIDEHRNLGVAFHKTGMLEEAMREFRRVIELRPSDGSVRFYMGLIALKQACWLEAIEHFQQAAERGGPRATILYNLALSYERAGRLDEAEAAYANAASKARHDHRVLTGWGIAALHRGEAEVAAGRLDRAREVAGESQLSALWYWARSLAAAVLGNYDDAAALLREGIALYPQHVVLRNNLGVLLEILGDAEQAEEVVRGALADDPSLPQLSKNLGDILYRAARYDEAWEAYLRAVKLQPNLGDDIYFKLGNIAYKRLDRESAAEFWRKALELNPKHELARTNLETVSALA